MKHTWLIMGVVGLTVMWTGIFMKEETLTIIGHIWIVGSMLKQ